MGKLVVYSIFAVAVLMTGAVYWGFKSHPAFQASVETHLKDEFFSYATRIEKSQKLQVAELSQMEVFERTSSINLFWNQVQLPDIVVAITAPVTFTYFVDLNKPWEFQTQDKKIVAFVPDLEFNTPALDLSATKFEVKKGSIFRNEKAALSSLQKQVTQLLQKRGETNESMVRETARTQISQFVTTWLQSRFPKEKNFDLQVVFLSERTLGEKR